MYFKPAKCQNCNKDKMQNCKQGNLINDETVNLKKGKQFKLSNRKAHCRFKGTPAKRKKV
jgi:hypothetical protein